MRKMFGLLFLISLFALDHPVSADPIQWPVDEGGNDHWYEWIELDLSWTSAYEATLTMTFEDMPGHLATLISPEESAFVESLLPESTSGPFRVWIGLYQLPEAGEPAEDWIWVTGELLEWTDWFVNEPNDLGDEDYCELYTNGGAALYSWNDLGVHEYESNGFIVEYGEGFVALDPCTWSSIKEKYY